MTFLEKLTLHCKPHPANRTFQIKEKVQVCRKRFTALPACLTRQRTIRLSFTHPGSFKINPTYNSDGLINCLLQPGLLLDQPLKSMRANSFQLIKFCCTRTVPAAETKSIGLQADARVSWFLLFHLDSFILTRQLSSTYRDLVPSRQLHRDQWVVVHLPRLCKNACQP